MKKLEELPEYQNNKKKYFICGFFALFTGITVGIGTGDLWLGIIAYFSFILLFILLAAILT